MKILKRFIYILANKFLSQEAINSVVSFAQVIQIIIKLNT